MEYQNSHERSFTPRYYEMDRHGAVTPLTMLSLFEETAFSHCDDTDWSVYRLREEGFGWVLLNGAFRMKRYPRYKESFTIETRLAAARLFYGLREFVVKDGSGEEIGGARSLWSFYDVERRRPARILDPILKAWGHDPSALCDRAPQPDDPPGLGRVDAVRVYDVRFSDIDTNGHVNNVKYLEWALEALSADVRDGFMLHALDGWYLHQVMYGQRVLPAVEERPFGTGFRGGLSGASADSASRRFDLAVYEVTASGAAAPRLVSCARSCWKARPQS